MRVETPHREGCNNQLVYLPDWSGYARRGLAAVEHRDSIGRRHRHAWHRWLPLVCNTIDCPAVVLVRDDVLIEAVLREHPVEPQEAQQ